MYGRFFRRKVAERDYHMGSLEEEYLAQKVSGTPTERLVWISLYHLDFPLTRIEALWGISTDYLHSYIGGSYRALDKALTSLLKRGIVERNKSAQKGYRYRLVDEHADNWRLRAEPEIQLARLKAGEIYAKSGQAVAEMVAGDATLGEVYL
jgi:predicted transcriptional regulator